jgi:hypothetical protein
VTGHRALKVLAATLCALSAGCLGPSKPPRPSPVQTAQARREYPAPPPAPEHADGWPSAAVAVERFATAYINWTAQTVSADMLALARRSVGQARAAVQLAAAETAGDYELQRDGIANSGQVEAVAPLRGHPNQYVVVTRELTSATATDAYQGLAPAWHVTVATVREQSPGVWVVSGWQPES